MQYCDIDTNIAEPISPACQMHETWTDVARCCVACSPITVPVDGGLTKCYLPPSTLQSLSNSVKIFPHNRLYIFCCRSLFAPARPVSCAAYFGCRLGIYPGGGG